MQLGVVTTAFFGMDVPGSAGGLRRNLPNGAVRIPGGDEIGVEGISFQLRLLRESDATEQYRRSYNVCNFLWKRFG
jgi:hypothetical protein